MKANIPEKILELAKFLDYKKTITENELRYSIKNSKIGFTDIGNFVNFDHPVHESYGRYILYESNKVEIVVMSWNREDYTSIHDHGHAKWGAVCSFGDIQNSCFKIENNILKKQKDFKLKKGEITIVDNNSIHQMGNPYSLPAISLHIYYTDKEVESVTSDARNFELSSKNVLRADGGAFLELPAKNIKSREKCPAYEAQVYNHYIRIMQQYQNKHLYTIKKPRKNNSTLQL